MKQITIAAKDVKVGDRIYNSHAYHPSAAWIAVTEVRTNGEYTVITTAVYATWKSHGEGIAVQRPDSFDLALDANNRAIDRIRKEGAE